MKLDLRAIKNAGLLAKERVVLKANDSIDIGRYIIFRAMEVDESNASSSIEVPFWIPDKEIKKGDLVVVYTKVGVDSQAENANGTTSHFVYMGHDEEIWGDERAYFVLVEGAGWRMKKVNQAAEIELDEEPGGG